MVICPAGCPPAPRSIPSCPGRTSFKRWTLDIFHGVSPAHLQAYLDEYCYRLNRREQCQGLFRRVLNRCLLYTDPAPYSLLTGT